MFPSSAMENEQANAAVPATEATASPDLSQRLDRGKDLWARGAFDQAIAELGAAIRENSTNAEAYCLRGEVLVSTGDAAAAIADFSEAIRLDFHRLLTCASRVLAQTSQQQFDTAAAVARETLPLNSRLARAHVLRGRVLAEQGERARAIADFTQALELQPDNREALVHRGDAYCDNGDFALAIADFTAAIGLDSADASLWSKRGRAFLQQGNFDHAITDFTEALEREPESAAALADRGTAHLERGEHERALEDFNRAIHLDPRCPRTYVQRSLAHAGRCDYERALADFGRAMALDPGNYFSHENQDIARHLKEQYEQSLAELNRVRSDFQKAVASFAQAMGLESRQRTAPQLLGHKPTHDGANGLMQGAPAAADEESDDAALEQEADEHTPWPTREGLADDHFRQAQSFHASGAFEEAIEHYTMALQLDPACLAAYLERGRLHRTCGWFDLAIADFSAALDLDAGSAEAYLRRGNAYAGKGEYETAIADFDRALALAPTLAGAFVNRALAFAKLGEYERVIEDAERALEIDPRLISALFLRGAAYSKLDRPELAVADFDMLLLLDPHHVLAYNERGLAHASRGEYALAIADYTRALHLEPAFELAYFNRALAYRLAGEPDHAIAELDELIARAPDHGPAHYQRGLAHLDRQQYELAIADLTRAVQIDPQCKEAYTSCIQALRAKYQSEAPDTPPPASEKTLPPVPAPTRQMPSGAANEPGRPADDKAEEAQPVLPQRAAREEAPPTSRPQTTAPETTTEAARTLVDVGKLRLECPTCGMMGLLDVRNLQRAFRCPGCARWWRTDANGQLIAVTPLEGAAGEVEAWSNGPGRSKHRLPTETKSTPAARAAEKPAPRKTPPRTPPRHSSPGFLKGTGSWIAAASTTRAGRWALAATGLLVIASVGLAVTPLLWPDQLKSRGRTQVQSWLARDLKAMERFTLPTEKPFLESWLEKHPPPDILGQDPPPAVRISVERNDGRSADVVVQIAAKDKDGHPTHYVFHHRWAQQGGDWYFHPQEGKKTFNPTMSGTDRQGQYRR